MQLSLDPNKGNYYITAYAAGEITINDKRFKNNLIVAPNQIIENWPPQALNNIQISDLTAIRQLQPDIVLLGSGVNTEFPAVEIIGFFHQQHIGVEVMNTRSACRTFNVLISEGRRVVAGLIL